MIVPKSAENIHLTNLKFIPILDENVISKVVMVVRNIECTDDIKAFFDSIYQVYDLEGIPYNCFGQ